MSWLTTEGQELQKLDQKSFKEIWKSKQEKWNSEGSKLGGAYVSCEPLKDSMGIMPVGDFLWDQAVRLTS